MLPRFTGDDVATQVAARKSLSHEESLAMATKIKAAMVEDLDEPLDENKL